MSQPAENPGRVFLVRGRNDLAAEAITELMESVGLRVLTWEQAVAATGVGSPYLGEIVKAGMRISSAIVVVFTPDDLGCLDPRLSTGSDRPEEEAQRHLAGRARQNVVFEAGMALGIDEKRTVLVEVGIVSGFTDIGGRHAIRLDGSAGRRKAFLDRLKTIGCSVDLDGDRWLRAGDFENAVLPLAEYGLLGEADGNQLFQSDLIPLQSQLLNWHPSSEGEDLTIRCVAQLPAGSDLHVRAEPASPSRGEAREAILGDLLADGELDSWFKEQADAFNATPEPWVVAGHNAGDFSELIRSCHYQSDRPLAPLMLECAVQTGWTRPHRPQRDRVAALRVILDLRLRILELGPDRQPAEIRHATTPTPAPAALSALELFHAITAAMSAVDVAQLAFAALLTKGESIDGHLGVWVDSRTGIERLVDLSTLRRIPGSPSASHASAFHELPLERADDSLAPLQARRVIAQTLVADMLERSGWRGATSMLESLPK